MQNRQKKPFHIRSLIPQHPVLALVSAVLAFSLWYWVKTQSENIDLKKPFNDCSCECQSLNEPKKENSK